MRGDRVRELRRAKRLTQIQLAKEVGIAQGTLSSIESGQSEPSIEVLTRLARTLQVSADYLLGLSDEDTDREPAETALIGV